MVTRKIATLQHSIFSELGDAWINDGLVDEGELYNVLASHSESPEQFRALRDQGLLPEETLLQDLAASMACPYWNEEQLRIAVAKEVQLATRFSRSTLERLCVVPIHFKNGGLQVAISSWPTQDIFTTLQSQINAQSVVFGFATRQAIRDVLSYALAEASNKTQAASTINADLFDDSWDDWDAVPSTSSQQSMSQNSQPSLSQPKSQQSPSADGSVDDLLADFLTPNEQLPSASGAYNNRTATDSFARSLPAVDASPSSPKILSNSSSTLKAPSNGGSATGLAALEQSRSSQEWQSTSSGGILGSGSSSLSSIPKGPEISNPSAVGVIGADLMEARQASAKQRKQRNKKKNDRTKASFMAFVTTIFRILIAIIIGYLIYQGYQNGI